MSLHPDDLGDAVTRATKAANRAGLLPRSGRWVALPVERQGRWYIVVLRWVPSLPLAATYRLRSDFRLRRIVRPPWQLANLARDQVGTLPLREVEPPGREAGWIMTLARLECDRW